MALEPPRGGVRQTTQREHLRRELLERLQADIKANRLVLPMPPEVAVKARTLMSDPNCSIGDLARLINRDPALSARVMKVVNSVIYRAQQPITHIEGAITRLGLQLVRSLINQLSLLQSLYQYGADTQTALRAVVAESQAVAAYAHALCRRFTRLDPEQALLAGLTHNIGRLPLLSRIGQLELSPAYADIADEVVAELQQPVTLLVMQAWQFPDWFLEMVRALDNLHYQPDAATDYVDLIICARLLVRVQDNTPLQERQLLLTSADASPLCQQKLKTPMTSLFRDAALLEQVQETLQRFH